MKTYQLDEIKKELEKNHEILDELKKWITYPTESYGVIRQELQELSVKNPKMIRWLIAFYRTGRAMDWYKVPSEDLLLEIQKHLNEPVVKEIRAIDYLAGKINLFAYLTLVYRGLMQINLENVLAE